MGTGTSKMWPLRSLLAKVFEGQKSGEEESSSSSNNGVSSHTEGDNLNGSRSSDSSSLAVQPSSSVASLHSSSTNSFMETE